ncbi:hypothetical protein [Mesorhizobium sp.]|nr:hypothetical protein [Mesorhizobium sp.]
MAIEQTYPSGVLPSEVLLLYGPEPVHEGEAPAIIETVERLTRR